MQKFLIPLFDTVVVFNIKTINAKGRFMQKRLAVFASLAASAVLYGTCFAETPVNVVELKKITPVETFFTGKAESVDTHTLSFGANEGRVNWTLRPGDIFEGPVLNSDGSMAKEGTLIAEMDNDDLYGAVEAGKLAVKIAEQELNLAKSDLERAQKTQKAISKQDFEKTQIACLTAQLRYDDAKGALITKEYYLYRSKLYAPYTGIVVEVLRGAGMGTGKGDDVLRISKMNPIQVNVPFATEIVNLVGKTDPVFVYTPYLNKPEVGWVEQNPLDKNTLLVYAGNSLTATAKLTPEQQKLSKVYGFFPVSYFYEKSVTAKLGIDIGKSPAPDMLGVPKLSVRHDDGGDYVLRVVGAKALSETGIPTEFKVEKVYVKIGALMRDMDLGQYTSFQVVNFADPGSLTIADIVVLYSDDALKAGDTAVYAAPHWIFNPGDTVKVKIPGITPEGIYVPQGAIIHESEAANYVYIVDGNKAKLVEVQLVGRASGNYAITGNGIQEGAKVILPDDKKAVESFYDGMAVSIKSTIPPSALLTNKHAVPLSPIEELSFF